MFIIIDILEKMGIPYVEKYYPAEGLIRHYFLGNNKIVEIALP